MDILCHVKYKSFPIFTCVSMKSTDGTNKNTMRDNQQSALCNSSVSLYYVI